MDRRIEQRIHDNDSKSLRQAAERLGKADPWLGRIIRAAADEPYQPADKAKGA